ncbi:peroxiredoxin family protein [Dyadobacter tibetensis]|uniref:peroxiredoxin family protein n=1 Tax=Dyadobacter tibetensis TaxID=1211851 RepID=UPI0004718C98|nr:TlpA disulfide reductase family protein [Dyadobacter tibetensis]
MRFLSFASLLIFMAFISCSQDKPKEELQEGVWRAALMRDGQELPFLFEVKPHTDGSTYAVEVINGEERLALDTAYYANDSIHIPMRLFDSEIVASLENGELKGRYNRLENGEIIAYLPFSAQHGLDYKFFEKNTANTSKSVQGKWATTIRYPDSDKEIAAVGNFTQSGTEVRGSFLTPSGDYRFLTGSLHGDSLFLSNFDGSNAMLFKAALQADGRLVGALWTGVKGYRTWEAHRDEQAKLADDSKITYLKPGYDRVDFSFPDANGNTISLKDERFKGKMVILQIMGSWCPTCMDETNFLVPWYNKNKGRGVEIIGLSFETSSKPEQAFAKITRMKNRLNIDYPVLLAGTTSDKDKESALPMLNKVLYFPTTIFIDRQGKVREIHSGFSGPGTGQFYEEFKKEFTDLTEKLIEEK